jgi:hypothetical protein
MSVNSIAGSGYGSLPALQRQLRGDDKPDADQEGAKAGSGQGLVLSQPQFSLDTAELAASQAQNSQTQTQTQNAVTAIQSGAYQVDLYL